MNIPAQFGQVVVRIVIAGLGFLLIYLALFLHEDEEGKLQNRIEELWCRIYDLQEKALSKAVLFIQAVLKLTNRGFDALLGVKLFSFRSVVVTLCYSWASLLLVLGGRVLFLRPIASHQFFAAGMLGVAFLMCGYGTFPAFLHTQFSIRLWQVLTTMFLLLLSFLFYVVSASGYGVFEWRAAIAVATFTTFAVLCDILFVAANRLIVRFSSGLSSLKQLLVMLLVNVVLGVLYVAPLKAGFRQGGFGGRWGELVFFVSATNLFTALSALSIVFVMLIALLHRLLWPTVERPVYAIARHGVARKPVVLIPISLMLLTWAIPAWRPFWEVVGKLK